jgi:hypothetical protein
MQRVSRLQGQSRQAGGVGAGFSGGLFSRPAATRDQLREALAANGCVPPSDADGTGGFVSDAKAVCVRVCDGYYFPLGNSAGGVSSEAALCRAIYGGQADVAQTFVLPASDDIADATPVDGGLPYRQQPYAFMYRKQYEPSCVAQLQGGLDALAANSPSAGAPGNPSHGGLVIDPEARAKTAAPGVTAASIVAAPPTPRAAPHVTDDPETLANRQGGIDPGAVEAAPVAAHSSARPVRVVGAGYYNKILEEQERRGASDRRPGQPPP